MMDQGAQPVPTATIDASATSKGISSRAVLVVCLLLVGVSVPFAALYVMYNWSYWTFPDISEIDRRIDSYRQESSEEGRVKTLGEMLDRLKYWEWEEQDVVIDHAFSRLKDCYTTSHDPAILTALRDAPFDAHLSEWRWGVLELMEATGSGRSPGPSLD